MQIKLDPALEALVNPAPKFNDQKAVQEPAPVGQPQKAEAPAPSNATAMEAVLSAMAPGSDGDVHQLDADRVAALLDLDL